MEARDNNVKERHPGSVKEWSDFGGRGHLCSEFIARANLKLSFQSTEYREETAAEALM
jgi:hypothetical protein